MIQSTKTFKVYRELSLFQSLLDSMEELGCEGLLPLELIARVVEVFDETVARVVSQSTDQYSISGHGKAYRIRGDLHWILLENVIIKVQKPKSSGKKETSLESLVKKEKFTGIKFRRVRSLKLLCHKEVIGNNVIVKRMDNPYVVEVEKIVKKKKEKPKMKSLKESLKKDIDVFDPRAHSAVLSSAESSNKDFLRPMPYNEKLRRGGRENSLAIAESQLSVLEVVKGRYRRCAREYPHRCVQSDSTKTGRIRRKDTSSVPGWRLAQRHYRVMLSGEDRLLAQMAERVGRPQYDRCLHLTGHNIHVVANSEEGGHGRREQYSTRRKHMIEDVSYDVSNGFIKLKMPKREYIELSSDEESPHSPPENSGKETKIDPVKSSSKSITLKAGLGGKDRSCSLDEGSSDEKDITDQPVELGNMKLEAEELKEEINDIDDDEIGVLRSLLEVEPVIKLEDRETTYQYQEGLDQLEQFLSLQGEQVAETDSPDPLEVDAVLDGLMEDELLVGPRQPQCDGEESQDYHHLDLFN